MIRWLDVEVVRTSLWDMLAFFLESLTKTNFEDKIQFNWGRVVTSGFDKFLILGL